MRKTIIAIITIIIIVLVNTKTVNYVNLNNENNHYSLITTVIEINDNIVMIEDNNGEVWTFEGAENWKINDNCFCIMNDNGTQTIYDDEIVKIIKK